jgi:hypothetical protein
MGTGRWQGVITAWAVRGQAYPAVGAELPMRFNVAAAIAAFLEELVKCRLALEHGGLYAALLGLLLFLADHCAPSVLQGPASHSSLRACGISPGIHLRLDRKRVPQRASRSTHRRRRHLEDRDEPHSNLSHLIPCTPNTPCAPRVSIRLLTDLRSCSVTCTARPTPHGSSVSAVT